MRVAEQALKDICRDSDTEIIARHSFLMEVDIGPVCDEPQIRAAAEDV